jgi:hypothetical protein
VKGTDQWPNASASVRSLNPALFAAPAGSVAPVESGAEDALHEEIKAECLRRGWLAFYGSMAHRAYRVKGEPDFIVFAEHPTAFLVEAKTKTGKPSPDQQAIAAWALKLGWQVYVVRSLAEFREAAAAADELRVMIEKIIQTGAGTARQEPSPYPKTK